MYTSHTSEPTSPLKSIAEASHIPAVGYACVKPINKDQSEFTSTSLIFGKKDAQYTELGNNVDDNTRFPVASLSKIVFTYLVLQLAKAGKIDLDKPLSGMLECERLKVNGKYPDETTEAQAKQLTARHVLSHTTGLPNVSGDPASTLSFIHAEPGKKYAYSGEAFIYLQQVIEKETGQSLEELAQEHVFGPKALNMPHSTFKPQPEDDPNIVAVHTHLGKSSSVEETLQDHLRVNAAGSLLTTADDFSKFMAAWLENMDNPNDPLIQEAFEPMIAGAKKFETCGLGWHLYREDKEDGKLFAYQYGENTGMKSFVVLNLTDKKGAVIFTNSEHGMSIGNQLLSTSPDFTPIGDMNPIFEHLNYSQSDQPGWQQTLEGEMAEAQDKFEEARGHFQDACKAAPTDESKQRRLKWFNEVHSSNPEKKSFSTPLKSFVGTYKNQWGDTKELSIRDGCLIHKERGHEIKLVRISETGFAPEKDQSFKISVVLGKMRVDHVDGYTKSLSKQPDVPFAYYKDEMKTLRAHRQPGDYMRPTESSSAKEIDRSDQTTPKPPWSS